MMTKKRKKKKKSSFLSQVGSGEEMRHLDALVQSRRKEGPAVKLLPWIETARGVENALDIASASPNVFGLCFGADDLRADMQVERDDLVFCWRYFFLFVIFHF